MKDYRWIDDLKNRMDLKKLTAELIKFCRREAHETRAAARILRKLISNSLKLKKYKIAKKEIKFLKDHSADLVKLLPIIATLPTPIPYFEISLILKKFGIDLLPTEKDLEIPPDYQDK